MENIKTQDPNEIVRLDVSGTHFNATMKTLTSVPGSSLRLLFISGVADLPKIEDRVFIERNPKSFALLLDFLRDFMFPVFKNHYQKT